MIGSMETFQRCLRLLLSLMFVLLWCCCGLLLSVARNGFLREGHVYVQVTCCQRIKYKKITKLGDSKPIQSVHSIIFTTVTVFTRVASNTWCIRIVFATTIVKSILFESASQDLLL